jgi:hypothetical protein
MHATWAAAVPPTPAKVGGGAVTGMGREAGLSTRAERMPLMGEPTALGMRALS